jgi:hypothetical protein
MSRNNDSPTLHACLTKSSNNQVLSTNSKGDKKIRAAFKKESLWPKKYVIKIGFIKNPYTSSDTQSIVDPEYSEEKVLFVRQIVKEKLEPYIDITFQWDVPLPESDVRISFNHKLGAWSTVGTESANVSKNQPTMNIGWLDSDTDYDDKAYKGTGIVVLHEFGHMLGMIHEHSRADRDLEWNKEYIYKTLGLPPNSWNKDMVDAQIFTSDKVESFNGSEYDKMSMMHYFFDEKFFKNKPNLVKVTNLSPLDKEWLLKIYGQDKLQSGVKSDDESQNDKSKTSILLILLIALIILGGSYMTYYYYSNKGRRIANY